MKPNFPQTRLLFLYTAIALLITASEQLAALPSNLPNGIDPQTVLNTAKAERENWRGFEELEFAHMSGLGIRLIEGNHVDFYTDLAESPDIGEIVPVLDTAVDKLCEFFELDSASYKTWRVEAFLISDREPFEIFGAFNGAPEFENGYSLENRIWVFDKKQAYYNRFLLIHELVHSFMNWTFGDLNPRWYTEGIAEYLGLHRWDGKELTLGIFPENAEEVTGFGRIELIRKLVQKGEGKRLEELMKFKPDDFRNNETYAWSWGFVTLLLHSPRYADAVRTLPWLMMQENPNRLFWEMIGNEKDRLKLDWGKWITEIDYSADLILFSQEDPPAENLTASAVFTLDITSPGWQSVPIRLEAGKEYRIEIEGRFKVYERHAKRKFPCEAGGITIRYYSGAPLGQLSAAVVSGKSKSDERAAFPWDEPFQLKTGKNKIVPKQEGRLFFKFNIPIGSASKGDGTVSVTVTPEG